MKKSTILEISKLPDDHLLSSVNTDIDTLIHEAVYNLSQSSFSFQLANNDVHSRHFLDVVFPVAILKVCENLSISKEWKETKIKLDGQEKKISQTYQVLQKFKNNNINDNPFYMSNKSKINDDIEKFCDKYESLYFKINQRLIAFHAVMNENTFRKEFFCHKEFHEPKRKLNLQKLLKQSTIDMINWKKEKINEINNHLSGNDFNQTLIQSFASFSQKVNFDPDAPVYGSSFMTDFMPEIISRISSHNEKDWQGEVENMKKLSSDQQYMIGDANKIISRIISLESTWNKDDSAVLKEIARIRQPIIQENNTGLSL